MGAVAPIAGIDLSEDRLDAAPGRAHDGGARRTSEDHAVRRTDHGDIIRDDTKRRREALIASRGTGR